MFSIWGSPFHMVIPIQKRKKFPFGDFPLPNRVCAHLGININTPEPTLVEPVPQIATAAAVDLEQDTLLWHVLKVGEEGNNAFANIAF